MSDRIIVVACPCPGTPHEQDTITLYDALPTDAGIACYMSTGLTPGMTIAEITGKWSAILARNGVERWSFVNAEGEALPITMANNDGLPFGVRVAIANTAMERWQEELFRPLPTVTGNSSRPGPTDVSMSPNLPSGVKHPKHSKRSLPNGSAGRPSVAQVP